MPTLTVSDTTKTYHIEFQDTPTVHQVLEQAGIVLSHPCGGRGVCGKCIIRISGNISAPDDRELAAGCRLSCRTRLYGDASVVLSANTPIIAEGSAQAITGIDLPNTKEIYGAAVDLGTTTVVLSVYELISGSLVASASSLNPQSAISADVIGRMDAAMHGGLQDMQDRIRTCITALAGETGYLDRIDRFVITGNTTMLYLFTGRNPHSLAYAPFRADYLFGETTSFLGKPLYLPECIHAFVGADITCGLLNSGMCDRNDTALLCDIGTNGELALWKEGRLYTASTAAGPVFEGAGISCGCQSIAGAIEHVTITDNTLTVQTIGNSPARGICGSGIIDAVACLLDKGAVDETGAMEEAYVTLCPSVTITQEDIRSIQLAKAAIAAGIKTLLTVTETKEEEITTLYIAGGFGSHLHLHSAIRIGLLPEGLRKKITILGNAALQGAASFLTDASQKEKAHRIVSNATCLNLGGMPEFYEHYINEMNFPALQ